MAASGGNQSENVIYVMATTNQIPPWGDPVSEWGQLVAWQLPEGFLYDKSQSGHGHTLFGGLFGCVHASLQEYVTRRSVDSYGCLEASLCQSMVKRIETASNG